jgi:hypothetical protein
MLDTVGFDEKACRIVAVESFDPATSSIRSRRESTKIALEAVKERIDKIWEAIRLALQKVVDWLVARFKQVFGAAESLKKRAENVLDRVSKNTTQDHNFSLHLGGLSDSVVQRISIEGRVPSDLVAATKDLLEVAEIALVTMPERNKDVGEKLVSAIEKKDMNGLSVAKELAKPIPGMKLGFADISHKVNGISSYSSKKLFGSASLTVDYPLDTDNMAAHLGSFDASVFFGENKVTAKTDVKVPTVDGCAEVAKSVQLLATMIIDYKKGLDEIVKLQNRAIAAASHFSKLTELRAGMPVTEQAADILHFQQVARHLPRVLNQPAERFSIYALQTGAALMSVIEQTLKHSE